MSTRSHSTALEWAAAKDTSHRFITLALNFPAELFHPRSDAHFAIWSWAKRPDPNLVLIEVQPTFPTKKLGLERMPTPSDREIPSNGDPQGYFSRLLDKNFTSAAKSINLY